jgi:predicted permease
MRGKPSEKTKNGWEMEMNEELRFHLERQIDRNLAAGMTPEEARRQALLRFGGIEGVKEECREERRGMWLETIWGDVRFGARLLAKSPGFTLVAVLTLALGIGASTAVFSLVNAILLKPLSYPNPDRIVMVWDVPPAGKNFGGYQDLPWGRVCFLLFVEEARTFQALGAFKSDSFNFTGSGDPARLDGIRASAGFFPALGVSPVLGRTFTEEEDQPGHEHEVILSYGLWRDRFGADPGILSRVLELNGEAYAVIGVMPSGFVFPRSEEMPADLNFPSKAQLWVPLALNRGPLIPAEPSELAVIGRLKPDIPIGQSRAEMDLLGKRLEAQYPQAKGWFRSRLVPLGRQVGGNTRQPLLLLLAAVGVVLLIACANTASLLLARSLRRRREFALRAALGAGRRRIIRQLMTESLLLASAGGMAGLLLALAGVWFVKSFGPIDLPRLREVGLDLSVLTFALGTTIVSGVLFGVAPALGANRQDFAGTLKIGGQRLSEGTESAKLGRVLLVAEVALALILVVTAGLLTRTFFRLLQTDPGFRASQVLTFELSLPASKYPDQARIVAIYQQILEHLRSLPGVQSAGIVETVPLGGATEVTAIRIPGRPSVDSKDAPATNYTMISPGYFLTLRTPILRGRDFQESDTADSVPVAIISASMAREFWPGEDPLGKQVGPRSLRYPAAKIVGIAADVKHLSLGEKPVPEMYVPYTQKVWPSLLTMDVILRSTLDPTSLTAMAREAVHSSDPDLPLAKMATLSRLLDDSMTQPRFTMLLLSSFGGIALLLASIGMYGVIAYSVSQRTHEIGIRMALGAQRGSVFRTILGQGARLAGLGILIGFFAALGVTRFMAGFLYGVQPSDGATFAGASLLLLGVAVLACYLPARRAMHVDPMVALRYE